jgi:hypothetical protein
MTFEWFYTLRLRLRSFFRRKQVDQELKDELSRPPRAANHGDLAAGMSPEDARYSALRALGGMTQIEPDLREVWCSGPDTKPRFRTGRFALPAKLLS